MQIGRIKVVIVGQDPYPVPDVATGLAFAVGPDKPFQPSLQIIQTELAVNYYNDIGYYMEDGTLESWEEQGVLLLNASLSCTVNEPESEDHLWLPESHSFLWRMSLMENLFIWMDENINDIVFVFMGRKAQYYQKFIKNNACISTYHPVSDFYSGNKCFIGSNVFTQINQKLTEYGKEPIAW